MYKAVNKTKAIKLYIDALALHTGSLTVNWENNTSCIYVVEAKIGTPLIKNIDITVCFIQEQFDNGLFVSKYENYRFITEEMCTKLCLDPITSQSTKWTTGL